jgi:hypothetical protein
MFVPVVVIVGAAATGWWAWAHPQIELINDLIAPIVVKVDGNWIPLAAAADQRVRLGNREEVAVEWRQSDSSDASLRAAAGDALQGSLQLKFAAAPWLAAPVHFRARDQWRARFAPLITNASRVPLHIRVNAELTGQNGAALTRECDCLVAPGTTRQFIGYYPLFANSNIRAVTATGDSATFENIGAAVDAASGRLPVRFADADFRHP